MRAQRLTRFLTAAAVLATGIVAQSPPPRLILDVATFGAIPDDGIDDLPALQSAVSAAGNDTTLVFSAGVYDIDYPASSIGKAGMLDVSNLDGLWLEGNGATFDIRGFDITSTSNPRLWKFTDCDDLRIQSFTVTMQELPFTVGVVSAPPIAQDPANNVEASFTVTTPTALPASTKVRWLQNFDGATNRLTADHLKWGGLKAGVDYAIATNGTSLTLTSMFLSQGKTTGLDAGIARLVVGDTVELSHQKYSGNAFTFVRCSGVELQDMVFRASPGAAGWFHDCADVTIDGCDFVALPGQPFSLTADGFNFNRAQGDIVVQHCNFARPGDDAINVHANWFSVEEIDAANSRIKVMEASNAYNAQQAPVGRWYFAGVDLDRLGDGPVVSTTCASVDCSSNKPGDEWWLQFSGPVPVSVVGGVAVPQAAIPDSVTIDDCTFTDNNIRGIFMMAQNVQITGCTFTANGGPPICIRTDIGRYDSGPGCSNVLIQGCTMDDVNFSGHGRNGAISIYANYDDGSGAPVQSTYSAGKVHTGITIDGNSISNTPYDTIFIDAADAVIVTNNMIGTVGYATTLPWWLSFRPGGISGSSTIPPTVINLWARATNVSIDYNTIMNYGNPVDLLRGLGDLSGLYVGPHNSF